MPCQLPTGQVRLKNKKKPKLKSAHRSDFSLVCIISAATTNYCLKETIPFKKDGLETNSKNLS